MNYIGKIWYRWLINPMVECIQVAFGKMAVTPLQAYNVNKYNTMWNKPPIGFNPY